MGNIISQTPKKRSGKRLIIWLIIILVVVAAATFGWAWWQHQHTKKSDNATKSSSSKVDTTKVAQVQQQANAAAYNTSGGSVAQAVSVYNKSIQATPASDTATTAALYYSEAELLYNNKQMDAALAPAQKAAELNPTPESYWLLGTIYVQLGRKSDAIATFKEGLAAANALPDNEGPGKGSMTHYFTEQIQQLGGS